MAKFKKGKGRVRKDVAYFSGLYALRSAQGRRSEYVILAPDMETLRSVWAQLNPAIPLDESKVHEIAIFQKESVTDAVSK